ncbi:MAG TPA: hypothetical protein VKY19_13270 [Ktedonosporobacter sp.]|jgi:hypothetical protein|nr:hypothetical protein [Ktedonosporobacter sp.]
MDVEELLNKMEGLRNDIPDFLRNDYDKLIRDLRQIYEASIKYIAPSWPVADAHRHLQTHSTNLDTLHGQLNKSLPGFKQLYQGQGSDAYHATAGMALQDLGMLRDHASFATQQHQTIANNLDDGLIQRGLLAFFVLDAFISLTAFVGSGGSTAPVTIPAMVISVAQALTNLVALVAASDSVAAALGLLLFTATTFLVENPELLQFVLNWTAPPGSSIDVGGGGAGDGGNGDDSTGGADDGADSGGNGNEDKKSGGDGGPGSRVTSIAQVEQQLSKDKVVIVLGEGQKGRVDPVGAALRKDGYNVVLYEGDQMPENWDQLTQSDQIQDNGNWVQQQIAAGAQVVNLGPDGRPDPSPYYQREMEVVSQSNAKVINFDPSEFLKNNGSP